ncbi:hypothetical protein [Thiomicrospira pelophila]|uniref:hypothetical protein n=1 Tax=Thiomicrospira pelophila TaxID=934 RepID=UPI0004A71B61|nr:hypothetical protein [Thiomicrospira pelophila]
MNQINQVKEYLSVRLELWVAYHNHKENMSNAGFLVQISLFSAVITNNIWPPEWVAEIIILPELATFLVYGMLWFLIHYYTRWQLINKRISAFYVAGFDQAFQEMITSSDPQKLQLKPYEKEAQIYSKWRNFLARIIYIPKGFVKMDASVAGLPHFVAEKVKQKFDDGSGADSLEFLMTYTSIVLLFLVGVKVFFG